MYDFSSRLPRVEPTIRDEESDTGTTPGRRHPVFAPIPQQGAMQSVSFIHPQLLNKRPLPRTPEPAISHASPQPPSRPISVLTRPVVTPNRRILLSPFVPQSPHPDTISAIRNHRTNLYAQADPISAAHFFQHKRSPYESPQKDRAARRNLRGCGTQASRCEPPRESSDGRNPR